MATSAQTLSLIIDEFVKAKPFDRASAVTLLAAKGLLPKKLTEVPKEKKVSRFASKAAEDFADAKSLVIPEGFKGTAANDKISVKDLKQLAEGPKKTKANASPPRPGAAGRGGPGSRGGRRRGLRRRRGSRRAARAAAGRAADTSAP